MNNEGPLTREMAITEQVQQALQSNEATGRHPIEVTVQGATVSLHGSVDSQETKDTAERLARTVSGVVDVTNELVIGEEKGGWLGLGRDRNDDVEVPPVIGAAGLANRGGATRAGQGTGTGTGAAPGAVPLTAAELAGATAEDLPPEESSETSGG